MLESLNRFSFLTPASTNPNVPLLIYLPGMDGTGQLFDRQIPGLEKHFDIRRLSVALDDLSGWEQFTKQVVRLIQRELEQHPRQCVYLCGESFGGCLALKIVLHAPEICDRLILINPASSFKRYPLIYWGSLLVRPLPAALHRMSCVSFLPFLSALERMEIADRQALLQAVQSVNQETSIWRLALLREFHISELELHTITQQALIIASGRDRLLPSLREAEHLMQHLADVRMHTLPYSGHACLLEVGVDLYEILTATNFLPKPQPVVELNSSTR